MLANHTHTHQQLPCTDASVHASYTDKNQTTSITAYPAQLAQTSTQGGSTMEGRAPLLIAIGRNVRFSFRTLTSLQRLSQWQQVLPVRHTGDKRSELLRRPGQTRRNFLVQDKALTQQQRRLSYSETCCLVTSPAITNTGWSTCRTGEIAPH